MKKFIKRLLGLVLSTAVLMSMGTIANATTIPSMDNMRSVLLEKGFTNGFLDRRTELQIQALYERCNDNDVVFGGSEISYLNEDGEAVSPLGAIPEYDMTLEVSTLYDVGNDGQGNNTYDACWVYVYYEWTSGHPAVRKVDALSVNWDPNVWAYDGDFVHTDYSNKWIAYSGVTRPTERAQGGLGYYTYLDPSGSNLIGDTTFTLVPAETPLYPAGSAEPHFRSEINVNYVHDKNPLPVSGVSLSIEGVGVGITFGGLCDEASDTYNGYYKWNP